MPPATDKPPTEHRWLRRFTYLVILATFSLIAIGGHVTSTDVGLAVPDGFTTFGHNTLLAPLEVWWYDFGTRWEHGHRLKGNVVGMMSITMAVWLLLVYRDTSRDRQGKSAMGRLYAMIYRLRITLEGPRPYLRLSGVVMLVAVSSQGIMGALRVSEISLTLAFVHGICGQLILCGWIIIAAALSKSWLERLGAIKRGKRDHAKAPLRWAVRVLLVLLLIQLTLGSAVRHFKADKAPPDMMIYGQLLPPMSQESLDRIVVEYHSEEYGLTAEETGFVNRTPQGEIVVKLSDVDLQISHRIGALVVSITAVLIILVTLRRATQYPIVCAPALLVLTLLATQVAFGVITVVSKTDPIMATLHQATGAILFASSTWLAVRIHLAEYAPAAVIADVDAEDVGTAPAPVPRPQEQRTPVTA